MGLDPQQMQKALVSLTKQVSDIRTQVDDHDKELKDAGEAGGDIKSIQTAMKQLEKRVSDLEKKVKK